MGLLSKVGGGLIGGCFVFAAGGLLLPSQYALERSVTVAVPLDVAYEQVLDLKRAAAWSMWEEVDPSVKVTLGDVTVGEGATATWAGERVGAGTVEITRVEMNRRVNWKADVAGTPFEGAFIVRPASDGTEISWLLIGDDPTPLLGPYHAPFMRQALEPVVEQGLATVKAAAIRAAEAHAAEQAAAEAVRVAAEAAAVARAAAQVAAVPQLVVPAAAGGLGAPTGGAAAPAEAAAPTSGGPAAVAPAAVAPAAPEGR